MDENALVQDIFTTKNTLTILQQVFAENRSSLQQLAPIFISIKELDNVLTYSSVKQIEYALLKINDKFIFNKIKDTLNELSDAITANNTSTIDHLQEQLSSYLPKLRVRTSQVADIEETAEKIFKKQIVPRPKQSASKCTCNCRPCKLCCMMFMGCCMIFMGGCMMFMSCCSCFCLGCAEGCRECCCHCSLKFKFHPISSVAFAPGIYIDPITTPPKPRLMISYNWNSQAVCKDIYKALRDDGYEVWFDLVNMHGSTLVAMAQAVEDSDIILVCMTEKYSQSRNCQTEAEYAWVKNKVMIPLLMQSKYKPSGWLGLTVGAKLYIDFTKNDFTQNYTNVVREIEASAKHIRSNTQDVVKLTPNSTRNDAAQETVLPADNNDSTQVQVIASKTVPITKQPSCCGC